MKISLKVCRIIVGVMLTAAGLIFVGAMIFLVLQLSGKSSLTARGEEQVPLLAQSSLAEKAPQEDNWEEGDVRYQGVHYRYNRDILTFLFLGIDKEEKVKRVESGTDGGQSDAIFLLVLDPHKEKMSVIGINRDTMTDIDVYNWMGDYLNTTTGQLCLQHGYGDGAELSCERSEKAVSNLFYGLPIDGYCSINMGAIPLLNDAVGGVELTALEDVPRTNIKKGQTILLKGQTAYAYLHNRDTRVDESARMRLERQKQYLTAYAATAIEALKEDLTLPVTLYNILQKYMVTDITLPEIVSLATQVSGYTFSGEDMYSLEGETRQVGEHEGFYPDETALYELILHLFYEEVEEGASRNAPR